MKYALLIYPKPGSHEGTPEERATVYGEYMAIRNDPACLDGAQLDDIATATTLRQDNGRVLMTDGPFADTKEVFGGYFIVDARDLDHALDLAQRIPAIRLGGAVEVRPVLDAEH